MKAIWRIVQTDTRLLLPRCLGTDSSYMLNENEAHLKSHHNSNLSFFYRRSCDLVNRKNKLTSVIKEYIIHK
jgi:hypothetical protein